MVRSVTTRSNSSSSKRADRLLAVDRRLDVVPGLLERVAHHLADRRLVVHDENPAHPAAAGSRSRRAFRLPEPSPSVERCRRSSRRGSARSRDRAPSPERRGAPGSRTKRSKTRSRSAGGTPGPRSATRRTRARPRRPPRRGSRSPPANSRAAFSRPWPSASVIWLGSDLDVAVRGGDVHEERVCGERVPESARSPPPRSPPHVTISRWGCATPESSRTTSISSPIRRVSALICSDGEPRRPPTNPASAAQFSIAPRAAATGVFRSCASAASSVDFICSLVRVSSASRAKRKNRSRSSARPSSTAQPSAIRSLDRMPMRDEHARPLRRRRESADRCPCLPAPKGMPPSCPAGRRAPPGRGGSSRRRSPRRGTSRRGPGREGSRPVAPGGRRAAGSAATPRSDSRLVSERKASESRVMLREVAPSGFDLPQALAACRREPPDQEARDRRRRAPRRSADLRR